MICLNCKKKEISKANKFCDYYGTEIILKENENEVKPKKDELNTKDIIIGFISLLVIVVVIVIVIIAIVGAIVGNGEEEVPQIPFYQQPITENSVREAVGNLRGTGENITKIEVNPYAPTIEIPDDMIVNIHYKSDMFWVGKYGMGSAALTAIKAMEVLFENPKVAKVVMWREIEVVDKYGATSTALGLRIAMDRETADKIVDWEHIRNRATLDFNTFFDLAELQYIHPVIRRGL